MYRLDRNWSENGNVNVKRGGGLACYIKKGIKHSDTRYKELNVSTEDIEMQWISISFHNVRPIVLVNVYRPPQGDYKKCCSKISEAFLKANLREYTVIYLLGDFNINVDDRKLPAFKELDFTTRTLGLKQLVKDHTRISVRTETTSRSRIDLIFSNSDIIKSTSTLDINIIDHQAIMLTRKKGYTRPTKVTFTRRSYKNYVREDFQESLVEVDWARFYNTQDPNVLWKLMEKNILENIDKTCPLKSYKVNEFREPWITNEAIEAIKDKDRLMKRAKRTGLERDWQEAKRVRNEVGSNLRNLRADYLTQQQ